MMKSDLDKRFDKNKMETLIQQRLALPSQVLQDLINKKIGINEYDAALGGKILAGKKVFTHNQREMLTNSIHTLMVIWNRPSEIKIIRSA